MQPLKSAIVQYGRFNTRGTSWESASWVEVTPFTEGLMFEVFIEK
jgi:hypothetical protein